MEFFSIEHILVNIAGYPLSYLEFFGTASGFAAVWLATRNNIITWPVGLFNVVCFFSIFWQVRLYSDMLLQVYYLGTAIYGWWFWANRNAAHGPVSALSNKSRLIYGGAIAVFSVLGGYFIERIHLYWPKAFPQPAAYPYADTAIAISSVAGNWLLARKKIENWVLWIAVDMVAAYIYYKKGIKFVSIQYFIFFLLAISGFLSWKKILFLKRE